jgi:TolB-like protein/DNA-binding SARP family transcriptional activator
LLRLFGDFQLSELATGERVPLPGKRERVLLAYLALSPGGRQPRRKLVTLLWGEDADETTLDNLRTSVFNLRKALGDTDHRIVASEDRDIVLDASAFEVDVLALRRLAASAAVPELGEAAKLYTGDFLDGLSIESDEFESWRREESARTKGQVLDALARLMTQLAASGESDWAIEAGLRILRLEPLHETAVRHLMRLYAGSDRRATAAELYRTLSESLKKELGAQPEPETRAVYAEITRGGGETRSGAVGEVESLPPTAMDPSTPLGSKHMVPPVAYSPPAIQTVSGRKIGWLAGGLAGAAALAMVLFTLFAPASDPASTGQPATVIAATPTTAIALAVLPFANLSTEPEQEFFSDGLTEEITSALARVPDLKVVARTSAFEFKGKNVDIRTMGMQLGATHLIEGSVRKAGDRVRITAQLIRADDGTNVWSENYDRQLTDIFVIQEDIARAIAAAMRIPLGLRPGENLVNNRAIDPESYQQFLRGKAVLLKGNAFSVDALAILEPVVARNPNYAPAWERLAFGYHRTIAGSRTLAPEAARNVRETFAPKREMAARRAIELDPASGAANMWQAFLETGPRKWVIWEDVISRVLQLDPNDPFALGNYAALLGMVGRVKDALRVRQQLVDLEPFIPGYSGNLADAMWVDGQSDAAIAIYKENLGRAGAGAEQALPRVYAALGRYKDAADTLSQFPSRGIPRELTATAERLLRSAPERASLETLPALGLYGYIYLYVGAPDRALEFYEEAVRDFQDFLPLWHPSYAPMRKLERFKPIVRAAGLVDYWRERGWPEFCRPTTGDDFECE